MCSCARVCDCPRMLKIGECVYLCACVCVCSSCNTGECVCVFFLLVYAENEFVRVSLCMLVKCCDRY